MIKPESLSINMGLKKANNFKLYSNSSNNFTILFAIVEGTSVKLSFYDIYGRVVNSIGEKQYFYAPGVYETSFSSHHLKPGIYFAKFSTDNQTIYQKLLIIR